MMTTKKQSGLGKGLDAIFGNDIGSILDDIQNRGSEHGTNEILVSEIQPNPYQPRKKFDEAKLQELAESIKEHGVFTPILVKKGLHGYELIAGERRLRASKLANKETIPAIIMDFDDRQMMEIALLENIQREDLNAIEEAQGYQKIIEKLELTQEELAKRIGKSREHVTNMLRLLKLPKKLQGYVVDGKLSMGHVRALLAIEDPSLMEDVANEAIEKHLSVRAVENLVKQLSEPKVKKEKKPIDPDLKNVMNMMQSRLSTKVKIDDHQIHIHYTNIDDLNRILEIMNCLEEE